MDKTAAPVPEAATDVLRAITEQFGTPTYAYDIQRIKYQVERLRATLPPAVELLYSLKANPALGLCALLAKWGLGADVASAGELQIALESGIPASQIFISGPYKSPALLALSAPAPGATFSIDSVSELEFLAPSSQRRRAVLRIRPDFPSAGCMDMGSGSRFGIGLDDLRRCRDMVAAPGLEIVGFHIYAGSQVLDTAAVASHLRNALDLAMRAADALQLAPEVVNLGGGFGIPYQPDEDELDLASIAEELGSLVERAAPTRIVLELGRYIVAQAGWYLTRVVALQHQGERPAVVVDGGTHQRADLCGLNLRYRAKPPLLLTQRASALRPTDVWGCLCLPSDVLAEGSLLPALALGDVLAFPNAGAYGLTASPMLFLSHPAPAEVVFDGLEMRLLHPHQIAPGSLTG